MKRVAVPLLGAVLLIASDHRGVRLRGTAKDYPSHGEVGGVTIAAAVVPAGKVQHEFGSDLVKAGYTVIEIAVFPDAGSDVDISSDDFSMTVGSNSDPARADSVAEVARSMEPAQPNHRPHIPANVHVETDQTIGATSGGYDPATGRRYPGGVYSGSSVGVGIGDSGSSGAPPQAHRSTLRDKLEAKALPEGRINKAVAGYVYFPEVGPRLKNSSEPYQVNYSGPAGEIHLTVPR